MLDPRTRDAIRQTPESIDELTIRMDEMEKLLIDIHKFTRSTNESVVRKYGEGKKNAIAKTIAKVKGDDKK